jgi:diamine N-acetyltransferase
MLMVFDSRIQFSRPFYKQITTIIIYRGAKMNIRYGTTDDAKMLSELGTKTFYDTFAKDNTSENIKAYLKKSFSPEVQLSELADPNTIFLIAELDGVPIGYAKLKMNSKDESIKGTNTLELERIYALQEYLGKGIGKELMKASINEARERGFDRIWLGVWEKNQRAIDFYRKWGFKGVGTHVFKLGDDPQNDFLMELELT